MTNKKQSLKWLATEMHQYKITYVLKTSNEWTILCTFILVVYFINNNIHKKLKKKILMYILEIIYYQYT